MSDTAIALWIALTLFLLVRGSMKASLVKSLRRLVEDQETLIEDYKREVSNLRRGGDEEFPLAVADAAMIVMVIDRVPEDTVECMIRAGETPVIWMHPRLQRSWRWRGEQGTWEENSVRGHLGLNHMTAFLTPDLFVHTVALEDDGAIDRLRTITTHEPASPETTAAVAGMHPQICESMDDQAGEVVWSRIREAHSEGRAIPAFERVQRGAPAERRPDNPFENHRRPVIVDGDDDTGLDNESQPR